MKTLNEAAPDHRESLSALFILNVGRPMTARVTDGKVWKGILQSYRNDGLIIRKKYGKVLWNWPYRHLRQIEVEMPLRGDQKLITMPD